MKEAGPRTITQHMNTNSNSSYHSIFQVVIVVIPWSADDIKPLFVESTFADFEDSIVGILDMMSHLNQKMQQYQITKSGLHDQTNRFEAVKPKQ